jgi:hypothetical protein
VVIVLAVTSPSFETLNGAFTKVPEPDHKSPSEFTWKDPESYPPMSILPATVAS